MDCLFEKGINRYIKVLEMTEPLYANINEAIARIYNSRGDNPNRRITQSEKEI